MQKAKNDMDLFNKIDLEYHLELARMTKNIFIITIIEELLIPFKKHIEETADRNYDAVYKFHYDIVQYIKMKDPQKAREVMMKSLEHLPRGYRLSDLIKI